VRVVFVDHLQNLTSERRFENRAIEIGYYARQLKTAARDNEVAVVLLAQIGRSGEHKTDKKPTLTDLKNSGDVEEVADIVELLHTMPDGKKLLSVAKNRNGPTDDIVCDFDKNKGVFDEWKKVEF
jgi:replicative DNA helicase